jgi:biofilm PGA synthesis protein PgaA
MILCRPDILLPTTQAFEKGGVQVSHYLVVFQSRFCQLAFLLVLAVVSSFSVSTMAQSQDSHAEKGDQAAVLIREAQAADDILERNRLAEQAIDLLDALIADPEATGQTRLRSRQDRVVALRTRERMSDVIDAHDELLADGHQPPIWVTEAAADAWLHQGEPARAEALYRQVLAEQPDFHNARIALFYTLIEQENYQGAIEHIELLVADTADRTGSWEWLEARVTAAMALAWSNRLGPAKERVQIVLAEVPDNARALRDMATIQRWRGWPNRALATAEQAEALAPDNIHIQLLKANILNDLGRYREADELYEQLLQTNPEHLHVQRDSELWKHRQRWSISLYGEYGDSDGEAISEFGSRDRAWGLRLAAPWLGDHLQPWFVYDYSDARFPEGEADYDRIGAGLSWRNQRRHAWASIHQNRSGPKEGGFSAAYEWQQGDHLSFAARYDSFSTDIPLRARNQDIDGWKAEFGARWQAHESFGIRANLSRLDISDGNVRWAGLIAVPHRLRSSAHHITNASLDLYASRASQEGGPYFNPKRDGSAMYLIEHDWLTWREYQQSFSQIFTLGAGAYWQDGFGSKPIGLARYDHVWRFNPRWRLRYGVGIASRVYDGDREERIHGRLTLEGVF